MQVFIRCRQDYAVGMHGAFALGLTGREIEAGCRLAGIAADRWPVLSEHVQEMGTIAAREINARGAS